MGIRDWLSGRKRGPKIVGKSKGGSRLLKYGGAEFDAPRAGFVDDSIAIDREERERIYEQTFGPMGTVTHELVPLVPHIDVYEFAPTERRPFFTFVTGGMSDLPMHTPPELGPAVRRIELVFYAAEDKTEYADVLRRLAHFAHECQTWIHFGHTMPNGTPPEPFFGTTHLDNLFFMPSIVSPDATLGERLAWRNEPVNLVWCVPITTAECNLKLERGSDALYDLFDEHQHPFIFSGDRASYV